MTDKNEKGLSRILLERPFKKVYFNSHQLGRFLAE